MSGPLRKRLDLLLADPQSSSREIGTIVRSLLGARKLDLLERQIRIAEQKLGGDAGTLIDLVEEAERRADDRRRTRADDGALEPVP
jgi:hypothetical protein